MKRLFFAVTIATVLAIVTWLTLPSFITSQIHKRHPEVSFGHLDLRWGEVLLHDVRVDKGWIAVTAKLATIHVRSEAVHFASGTIEVDLDKKPSKVAGTKDVQPNITADDFGCTVKSDLRGLRAVARLVHVDENAITAEATYVSYNGYVVQLTKATVLRSLVSGGVERVDFPEGLTTHDGRHTTIPTLEKVEFDRDSETVVAGHATAQLDVNQEHVEVGADDLRMHLDGETIEVKATQLAIAHPWFTSEGSRVHLRQVSFEVGKMMLQSPFAVKVADATLYFDPLTMGVSGEESCQTWLDALPAEMHVGPLSTVAFTGSLSFKLGVKPKPFLDVKGSCRSTCTTVNEPHHKFAYLTYDETGHPNADRRTTGPDVKDAWTPLSQINVTMPVAVRNMEDFGFYGHHGYLPEALSQSFVADVTSGKFQRGGSTITMQTAKNLWLSREKTISRKIEELFLSQVLESCLTKDEILETYLNIVEFGPNVYGVKQAAEHYFKEEPSQLSPREAFYLAWILPRPRKSPPPTGDVMARMSRLMQMLGNNDRIPKEMLLSVEPADTQGWEQPPP